MKTTQVPIFFRRTPTKVWSNLKLYKCVLVYVFQFVSRCCKQRKDTRGIRENVKHRELPAVKYYAKNQIVVQTCFSSCASRGLKKELDTL